MLRRAARRVSASTDFLAVILNLFQDPVKQEYFFWQKQKGLILPTGIRPFYFYVRLAGPLPRPDRMKSIFLLYRFVRLPPSGKIN